MILERAVDAFSDGDGTGKTVNTTWTYGDWQAGHDAQDTTLSLSYELGAALTTLEARLQLSHDGGTTTRGDVHVINFVSGGVIDVDDAVWELPCGDTSPHMFEATVRAAYAWRVGFKRTGNETTVLATAEVSTL